MLGFKSIELLDEKPKAGMKEIIRKGCMLCGGKVVFIGALDPKPEFVELYGGQPGQTMLIFFGVCAACFATDDWNEKMAVLAEMSFTKPKIH